jgi:hypothetical protein
MIDKYSGQVAYAVATFGGFLGIGENFFPLPWKVLEYDTSRAGYVADVDRGRLEQAPNYVPPNVPDWGDRSFSEEIDKYWLPPV